MKDRSVRDNRKSAAPQIQAVAGATFAPWTPDDGPAAVLWGLLCIVASLATRAVEAQSNIVRLVSLRLANESMQRGWEAYEAWAVEARYAGAGTTSAEGTDLEAAHADLCRLDDALRQLERQLVGDPPPLARTHSVRPVPAAHTARGAAVAS